MFVALLPHANPLVLIVFLFFSWSIEHQIRRRQGVRILTVYLYLNDVPAGGGTNFDFLDIPVMPKRGRALIWPSVEDETPNIKDPRTTHQALPVEEGVKYGANGWFHQRDFKTPNREGCQ
jgi:prolyl 4-hydroxylase